MKGQCNRQRRTGGGRREARQRREAANERLWEFVNEVSTRVVSHVDHIWHVASWRSTWLIPWKITDWPGLQFGIDNMHGNDGRCGLTVAGTACGRQATIKKECEQQGWIFHTMNARTNHVHVVVSAQRDGEFLRRRFKALTSDALSGAGRDPNGWWAGRSSSMVDGKGQHHDRYGACIGRNHYLCPRSAMTSVCGVASRRPPPVRPFVASNWSSTATNAGEADAKQGNAAKRRPES